MSRVAWLIVTIGCCDGRTLYHWDDGDKLYVFKKVVSFTLRFITIWFDPIRRVAISVLAGELVRNVD